MRVSECVREREGEGREEGSVCVCVHVCLPWHCSSYMTLYSSHKIIILALVKHVNQNLNPL